jgi:hypothetical protein
MTSRGIGLCAVGIPIIDPLPADPCALQACFAGRLPLSAYFSAAAPLRACAATGVQSDARYTIQRDIDAAWTFRRILQVSIRKPRRKDDRHMYTHIHSAIETRSGEKAELVFNVTDHEGNAVDLSAASAEYRLARRAGEAAIAVYNSEENGGITLEGNLAKVMLDTNDVMQSGKPLLGDFFGQLRVTVDDRMLVAAEGVINIAPVILPAV